jgi:hypothetical protein
MNQMDRISLLRRPHIIVEFSSFYFSNKMYHANHSSLAYSEVYSHMFFFQIRDHPISIAWEQKYIRVFKIIQKT